MGNQGTVRAYDRDAVRAAAMAASLRRLGATNPTPNPTLTLTLILTLTLAP